MNSLSSAPTLTTTWVFHFRFGQYTQVGQTFRDLMNASNRSKESRFRARSNGGHDRRTAGPPPPQMRRSPNRMLESEIKTLFHPKTALGGTYGSVFPEDLSPQALLPGPTSMELSSVVPCMDNSTRAFARAVNMPTDQANGVALHQFDTLMACGCLFQNPLPPELEPLPLHPDLVLRANSGGLSLAVTEPEDRSILSTDDLSIAFSTHSEGETIQDTVDLGLDLSIAAGRPNSMTRVVSSENKEEEAVHNPEPLPVDALMNFLTSGYGKKR